MTVRTEDRAGDSSRPVPGKAASELERIRRAAQLIATGTLSGSQSCQFAAEILRLVDTLSRTHSPEKQQTNAKCCNNASL